MDKIFYSCAKFKCYGFLASNTKLTLKLVHKPLASHPIMKSEVLMMVVSNPSVFQFPCIHSFFFFFGLNEMSSIILGIWTLGAQLVILWLLYLKTFRRCDLVGQCVSLAEGFETFAIFTCSSRYELSVVLAPMPAWYQASSQWWWWTLNHRTTSSK